MSFQRVRPEDLTDNVFTLIGKDWMLVTAARPDGSLNTMTASWGGVGILWGKPVAFVFIRPQRYTKEFIDQSQHLSLCFLPEGYRKQLNYLGTVSGRDEDKIAQAGLMPAQEDGIPYFKEAKLALLCRKLYAQPMQPDCFLDPDLDGRWYADKDYHTVYVVEIEQALVQR